MKPACFWMFLFVLPLSSCSNDSTPASAPDNGSLNVLVTEWVATEPTQCLTNAWEQDWWLRMTMTTPVIRGARVER